MNSISPSSIIRQKAEPKEVFKLELAARLTGPREDNNNNLYVCSHVGQIIKFNDKGEFSVSLTLPGQPICIAFDKKEDEDEMSQNSQNSQNEEKTKPKEEEEEEEVFYFADVANSVIYGKTSDDKEYNVKVKDYIGNPFKGPTSLVYAVIEEEKHLFFCDGGYFESTSLSRPYGSIFHVEFIEDEVKVSPLLLNCLAYPSDIFFDKMVGVGYVTETFANRLLRIVQDGNGYHVSVFYVFDGRVGPTAVTCDEDENIYVSRFEYQSKENDVDGIISVINKEGTLIGELIIPKMSEIVGMCIPKKVVQEGRTETYLYFTERNFSGVMRIKLTSFISEISKAQDNFKIF